MARGRVAHAITFVDDVTSTGTATQNCPLGTLRMEEDTLAIGVACYRYVKHAKGTNSVATAAGMIAMRGNTISAPWIVTGDIGTGKSGLSVGVYQSVMTDVQYGWIKTKGYQSNLSKQSGTGMSWAKGQYLFTDASTTANGKARVIKLGATTKVSGAEIRGILQRNVGFAMTAVSTTTATGKAYIDLE